MTEKEQLIKIIEKAIKNGWDAKGIAFNLMNKDKTAYYTTQDYPLKEAQRMLEEYHKGDGCIVPEMDFNLPEIIFDHSFCKAFFGEGRIICQISLQEPARCKDNYHECVPVSVGGWRDKLPELALAEDRLKYLGQFI